MAPKVARNQPTMEGQLLYSDEHDELFGRGWEHTVYTKAMLIHVEKGLRKLWRSHNGSYCRRITRPRAGKFEAFFRKHFKEVTGFQVTRAQEFQKEVKDNNGYLQPRDDKGREKVKLAEQFHQLPQWMEEQVERASRGSYLTIKLLMEKFKKDFIDACAGPLEEGQDKVEAVQSMPGKEVFRRALHDMNYDYLKRRVKRLEARGSDEVLAELYKFLRVFL